MMLLKSPVTLGYEGNSLLIRANIGAFRALRHVIFKGGAFFRRAGSPTEAVHNWDNDYDFLNDPRR